MENVYQSQFVELEYDSKQRVMLVRWRAESEEMTESQFKEEIQNYWSWLKQLAPPFILNNQKEMRFGICPELQLWYAEGIKSTGYKPKRVAMILPEEMISEISVEQTRDEIFQERETPQGYTSKYFEQEESALDWLLNK